MTCEHKDTHYEDWPDGGNIEVCEICGMVRHHWQQEHSDWFGMDDIDDTRDALQRILANARQQH
jgi:hypothetical protein